MCFVSFPLACCFLFDVADAKCRIPITLYDSCHFYMKCSLHLMYFSEIIVRVCHVNPLENTSIHFAVEALTVQRLTQLLL